MGRPTQQAANSTGEVLRMGRNIAALTRAVLFAPLFTVSRPAKVVLEIRRAEPTEVIQKAVEELLGDKATKAQGDRAPSGAEIARVAFFLFDVRDMAKRSLGKHWVARTPQERDEFTRVFTSMVGRAWLRTIRTGKRITYTGASVTGTRASVRSTVLLERQGQVLLEYQLTPAGHGKWQVHDVLVDRRSLVGSYREFFDKTLADTSYQRS